MDELRRWQEASLRLRDRDSIVTREGMIFRVYGYYHPPNGYVCDPEYAPAAVYQSTDGRAFRKAQDSDQVYYKFYTDEGLRFVQQKYPQYRVWYRPLHRKLVGVNKAQMAEARQPEKVLESLMNKRPGDALLRALDSLVNVMMQRSTLSMSDFGVFGSLLHGFYHPGFSDLDLIVYGRRELTHLRQVLKTLYSESESPLRNEFETVEAVKGKHWEFRNYSLSEYLWHQRRKQIYAVFNDKVSGRTIKAEFEPVKCWDEIRNQNDSGTSIRRIGWIRLLARITDDMNAPFMPSIYRIEPLEVLQGPNVDDIERIVSFVEEFRLQVERGESVVVEGNLEQLSQPEHSVHQVTLTHGPRYYEQVLKVADSQLE